MTETDVPAVSPHPCMWTPSVLTAIGEVLDRQTVRPATGFDPFAGPGFPLLVAAAPGIEWAGLELEPEWVPDPRVLVGDAAAMPWGDNTFDLLCTSPVFSNRMSDCHEAKDDSDRITYRHKLGRMPSVGSTAVMQWSDNYRRTSERHWAEAVRVLKSQALVIVNISNHIRGLKEQHVTEFHMNAWLRLGATIEEVVKVSTPKQGFGANRELRTDGERVMVFRGPVKDGML